jgi:Uma2 family endonuclease
MQNNFGHYLMMAARGPIIITKNGKQVARLTSLINNPDENNNFTISETSQHIYGGREGSYEEYLELSRKSEDRYEYIDGEIYFLASPRTTHQKVLQQLFVLFHNYFQTRECTVMIAPYDITLKRQEGDINVVQPDLVVICDLEENLDEQDYYMGTPELVIEILSDSTRSKDMVKKLDLYQSCGIMEYWIVNPDKQEIITYLFENKEIKDYMTYRKKETAESYIFDKLKIKLNTIFI